ncbi:MAG: alkaline phosphatase family protein [Ignavibacteria bacterium]|nr:alkaline phosphatase family protein [Ignavibacteria bacterium]
MKRIFSRLVVMLLCAIGFLQSAERPRLVIFISIDQMKAEYLDWYKSEFTAGLKQLCSKGTVFTNADLNHAPSETGPGHASLGTGSYPKRSGIIGNEWIDRQTGKEIYCVSDPRAGTVEGIGGGSSPKNLLVTGLGDWIKAASPASKVYAVSVKDRGAILIGGQRPDGAFWYDRKTGQMVTSSYYMRELPPWMRSFNAKDWVAHNVPDAWEKLVADSVYTKYGPDDMVGETMWSGSRIFPHRFIPEKKKEQIIDSPYGDVMVLDFAREIVRSEELGRKAVTDVLFVSLSCTDYVGHDFGGNSHEIIDNLIRLDRSLGDFLLEMEKFVGKGNLLVALSGDHAAMPLPEYRTIVEKKSGRRALVQNEIRPKIADLNNRLQRELNTTEQVIISSAFLNYTAATRAGVDSLSLERRIREGVSAIDGIAGIFFKRELVAGNGKNQRALEYYRRGYNPTRGKDFQILPCEYCLFTSSPTGTSHGTPYRYDTHLPIVFWGTGVRAQKVSRVVHTVDIAPTIAKVLGIATPSAIDGKVLKEIVQLQPRTF